MKPQVILFLTMLAGWMNRKQQLVVEYLLEEHKVLREPLDIHADGKRLRYTAKQQRRLSDAGWKLGRQLLMQFATLVTPKTIYAWHRKFVAMKFAPKNRDLCAAKERSAKRDALIIKIASENTGWGYGRIQTRNAESQLLKVARIELAIQAWEAHVLPPYDDRMSLPDRCLKSLSVSSRLRNAWRNRTSKNVYTSDMSCLYPAQEFLMSGFLVFYIPFHHLLPI
ncbi:MAG: hypothetical protein JW942_05705 [Opitutales bacterium]|nr:hypothetical protein [Opitutales bacterium]